ncbi:hypothetical protein ACQKE4_07195 [Halomonas sp. NPDC076908]|uniref:hypothetical protein n=1 Tax=Halomonas sp. NPDC076908 TaxID=3390567 RepID=UPI003D06A840
MSTNTDDTLIDRVGDEFEYRKFATDSTYSSEQQRWKLLDGIAKHAPGIARKGAERARNAPIPPIQVQERNETLAPERAATPRQETTFRSPHPTAHFEQPATVKPTGRSFSHLFEVYTNNEEEQKQTDIKRTSLKALLRQINS